MRSLKLAMKWLQRLLLLVGGTAGLILVVSIMYFLLFVLGNVDFSQSYRNINNYEGITFTNTYKHKAYKRTFWGLKEIAYPGVSLDKREIDRSSSAYELVKRKAGEHARITCCTVSPDGNYVLYAEAVSISNGASTDDDHIYYRVLNIQDGSVTTIYDGVYKCFWVTWQ